MSIRISRPKGALRYALRLPIRLYHMGLGGLLDHRFMLPTHKGRKSGRLYETVLEVVMYEKPSRTCYVMSGWGDSPDWYRNIKAHPALRVQVGRESYVPEQRLLAPDEIRLVWTQFRRKHPIEERMALWLYSRPGKNYKSARERRTDLIARLRVISFRPRLNENRQSKDDIRIRGDNDRNQS